MPEILVTIPAYNEQDTLGKVIADIKDIMEGQDYKIQVVSDGSNDNTVKVVKENGITVWEKPHTGLADTFRTEMRLVNMLKPKVIVHFDADGQYLAYDILRLIDEVRMGSQLVLGNRLDGKIEHMPLTKKVFNRLGSLFFSLVIYKYVPDMTTGIRAFTLDVAKLPIYSEHTYTVEQVIKARMKWYNVKSIPVTFLARKSGNSRLMKSSLHYLWNTVKNWDRMFRP